MTEQRDPLWAAQHRLLALVTPIREGMVGSGAAGSLEPAAALELVQALSGIEEAMGELAALRHERARLLSERDAARARDEGKARVLAQASHDLRMPLVAILGLAEMLLGGPDGVELGAVARAHIEQIIRSAGHMSSMLDDVLELSRLESGGAEVRAKPVDVRAFADDMAMLHGHSARSKGVRYTVSIEPGSAPWVRVDDGKLRRVVLNLVGNAIKFTPAGGRVELSISATEEQLRCRVSDDGPGIPPDKHEIIFEPYTRLDRKAPGVGLGLAIVRNLSQMLGGRLDVESAPGAGSSFTLTVPVSRASPSSKPPEIAAPAWAHPGIKVMVIDDIETNRLVLSLMLRKLGVTPVVVTDPDSACSLARDEPPSLVLLDLHMPDGDGISVAGRLRDCLTQTPIIMLSADVSHEARRAAFDSGVTDFVSKPVSFGRLAEVLSVHVVRPLARGQASPALRYLCALATSARRERSSTVSEKAGFGAAAPGHSQRFRLK